MRAFRIAFATLAFGAVLAGCTGAKSGAVAPLKTTPAEAEAYVAKLAAEPLKGKATAAADIASVRDALPKDIALTWDSLTFDAAAGATVLTNVKITPAQMPNVGVSIAEVRLWDFDAAFAKARMTGQRLTKTASLARRIEAKAVAVFGLETLLQGAADQASAAITDPAVAQQVREDILTALKNYKIGLSSLILDDVMLRPYEITLVKLPAGNPLAEAMPVFQGYAAVARTIAYDTFAANGLALQLDMSQDGQQIAMNVTADTVGARGVRGPDTDVAFVRNLKFDMKAPNPELPSAAPMAIAGGVDLYTFEGFRLDKLYSYLAKGQWPPRTETNLMSLGLWTTKNQRFALNGHDVFAVADATVDARDWYWFIPTKLKLAANDIVYDIDALMAFIKEVGADSVPLPGSAVTPAPAGPEIDPQIMQVLTKYGLNKPSIDYALGWDWNPKSGATRIDGAFGLDNYLHVDMKLEGGLPSFKAVSDLVPDDVEKTDGAAIGKVFEASTLIKSADLNIVDEGGLDKGFGLAVEIGKLMPVEPGQPDFFSTQTPDTLRQMAVAGIYALADQAATQLPAARDLLRPFATFVEKGGKIHVTMKPKQPLSASSIDTSVTTGEQGPAVMLQKLNMKVEHTPPAK